MNDKLTEKSGKWEFWIDRGGTFTDVIARRPDGEMHTRKLLSENPEAYEDAAIQAIRDFLELPDHAKIPQHQIHAIKMGTTVATNALLERKGEPTVLAITEGLGDILEIGYQARPKTFALNVIKPELLYTKVVEIEERVNAKGEINSQLSARSAHQKLQEAFDLGYRSIAIVLMHAYRFPEHEQQLAKLAQEIGFTQISTSHEVSPLTRIVSRGDTTVVDAYLTPILKNYITRISNSISKDSRKGQLLFMQSSGGLTAAEHFRGRDAILSGPAGGVVGAVHVSKLAGFDKIVGFDMGGTSTDVSHFAGSFERAFETEVAGVRMRVPMMHIHTVAAGGGSILKFDGNRFLVGPDSAGANPGPKCYRRDGPLTVTDINACLGKIQPDFFPHIFGPKQDEAIDVQAAQAAFAEIATEVGDGRSAEQVAEGFLTVAIEHMAQAVKKISIERGYDLKDYVLTCFGGAGGQHACRVAERLNIKKVFLHPFSGVLSAYGMGLAEIRAHQQISFEQILSDDTMGQITSIVDELKLNTAEQLSNQGVSSSEIAHIPTLLLRYQGTDTSLQIELNSVSSMKAKFETIHKRQFGFISKEKAIFVESIDVESLGKRQPYEEPIYHAPEQAEPNSLAMRQIFAGGKWHSAPVYTIEDLGPSHRIPGPAIIIEPTGTIIVEPDWCAEITERKHIVISHLGEGQQTSIKSTDADPVTLEVFNNLFMSIAEQMGIVLRNTSQSVNIKERLDFSCAIFDAAGELVANAPHVPVHLGSMDASVKVVVASGLDINPGDVFVQNNPYDGGSHLPDITVITPVFDSSDTNILFYVASRAHHADIGGISPGSMSPHATHIDEEGVVINCMKLVEQGVFQHEKIAEVLASSKYPARNIEQNISDLMAQVASNNKGVTELNSMVESYGLKVVSAYMGHIQDNAEESIRRTITTLKNGHFEYEMDSGAKIVVDIEVDPASRSASIDFTGTSEQQASNFNAPRAVTNAAVLYVFRCLVDADIPLNSGCMRPLKVIIPEGTMLTPRHPAAVVAGNVEVSQAVTNALFGALEALGSSQGTMNNLTFGNEQYQYYETICSGAPAGPGFNGASAVHTHMTNSRLTDPEVLELRYPVVLDHFSIRQNSGGKGRWKAGGGILRKIRFLEPMECAILSGHRRIPPFGSCGGEPGEVGNNTVIRRDGSTLDLGACGHTTVEAGDTIVVKTPTGGGFGEA